VSPKNKHPRHQLPACARHATGDREEEEEKEVDELLLALL
jgi:hypothetical protein